MGILRDAADSKQLHTAKAAADGLMAAYIGREGSPARVRSAKARKAWRRMSSDDDPAGSRTAWALAGARGNVFKFHAS